MTSGGSVTALPRVYPPAGAAQLREGLRETGFFCLRGHDVADELSHRVLTMARRPPSRVGQEKSVLDFKGQ